MAVWEFGRLKLLLHKGINILHEFSCARNAICVHVTYTVVTVYPICEGQRPHHHERHTLRSEKIVAIESPVKNAEKCLLFQLKSYFCSQDI